MTTPEIPADMALSPRFANFNVVETSYKEVKGVKIPVSIFLPKDAKTGRHPVHVRFHGGCFITGHRAFPEWFGQWILDLAVSKQAILISPDYRLMPEANGKDILQDIRDFYNWLATPNNFSSLLPKDITPDLDHLLVSGESAGGWCALQSSLLPASRPRISAVISHYPMIDMRDPHYTGDYEKQLFNPVAPQLDRSILKNYLDNMTPGAVITSAVPLDRVPLVISTLQQGMFGKFFGDESILYPVEALDNVDDLPPTWILHGTGDTVIPVDGTYKYEKRLREKLPHAKVHFHYDKDSDHGFDNAPGVGLDTGWVKAGTAFVEQFWPYT